MNIAHRHSHSTWHTTRNWSVGNPLRKWVNYGNASDVNANVWQTADDGQSLADKYPEVQKGVKRTAEWTTA